MRWDDLPRSGNIEDRRGDSGGGGGRGGFPMGTGGGLGIGGVIVLGIIGYALGIDPRVLIGGAEMVMGGGSAPQFDQSRSGGPVRTGTPTDDVGKFVAAVLGSADSTWKVVFERDGQTYQRPRLVMFANATQSRCGHAAAAMGPFYCPPSREIYLDTSFFRDLERRFKGCNGKACEFAQAYVIAHEVGHHVQNLLGILGKVQQAQRAAPSKTEANRMQVRVELQADCFAGIWANHAEARWKLLQPGDIDAALQTAAAIGDDMLQKRSQGYVVPDSFTHGSSEQRKRWFTTGFKQGNVRACNTFVAAQL
ncbi:MAG: metalloprotease [Alphaproteobacteria bacterium]|nr:metalloprotease [Alphaproteobacteria bacterium]